MSKKLPCCDPMVSANALAATGAIFYVGCAALVGFSRPTYMMMMSGWAHGININALPPTQMTGSSLLVGLVTFVVVSWVAGFVFSSFYNWFASMK